MVGFGKQKRREGGRRGAEGGEPGVWEGVVSKVVRGGEGGKGGVVLIQTDATVWEVFFSLLILLFYNHKLIIIIYFKNHEI